MPTPTSLRRHKQPEPLSHERLLKLCYAYQRLKMHTTNLQAQIDTIIENFQHSSQGRSTPALDTLITSLANLDAGITMALISDIHEVDIEIIRWEQRSSKLKSESRRQARIRSERNNTNAFPPRTPEVDLDPEAYKANLFQEEETEGEEQIISPTFALAQKGMKDLPTNLGPTSPLDNSEYKKSGLV